MLLQSVYHAATTITYHYTKVGVAKNPDAVEVLRITQQCSCDRSTRNNGECPTAEQWDIFNAWYFETHSHDRNMRARNR